MVHPYKSKAPSAFWDSAVTCRSPRDLENLYEKKFTITDAPIAAAGSCFAQHISRHLRRRGLNFLDVEPPPSIMPPSLYAQYGYGLYSARYGNIYTARQLLQLFKRAFGRFSPVETHWPAAPGLAGVVDPFRPSIEPRPFVSIDELLRLQRRHLIQVKNLFLSCRVFIFTLGLTEAWAHAADGAVYPLVPGTKAGGEFDEKKYLFQNYSFTEVVDDLMEFLAELREVNPECKTILTVSPVALAATATNAHVAVATMRSKSILRAVAAELCEKYDTVDYFPSYEIICSPATAGIYLAPDRRSVSDAGVEAVMTHFFNAHCQIQDYASGLAPTTDEVSYAHLSIEEQKQLGVICDEDQLMAFAPQSDVTPVAGHKHRVSDFFQNV